MDVSLSLLLPAILLLLGRLVLLLMSLSLYSKPLSLHHGPWSSRSLLLLAVHARPGPSPLDL